MTGTKVEGGRANGAAQQTWFFTPPSPKPAAHPLLMAVIPLTLAVILWILDRQHLAILVVVAATIITVGSMVSSTFRRGAERLVHFIADVVGRFLTFVLMGLVWGLMFIPVGVLMRLFRVDPLRHHRPRGHPTTWQPHIDQEERFYGSQFIAEREIGRPARREGAELVRHRIALGIVVIVALMAADLSVGMIMDAIYPQQRTTVRVSADAVAHADDPWVDDYYAAVEEREAIYDSSRAFVQTDVSSEYLNVQNGVRRSYQGSGVSDDSLDVFFFGGSVLWGLGQRDEHTIPSEVARLAEAEDLDIEVTNHGQSAYSLWQEVRLFEELLAAGQAPDVAVFFDGYNDAVAHFDRPSAGRETTTLEGQFQELLERGQVHRDGDSPLGALSNAVDLYQTHSLSGRLWQSVVGAPEYEPPAEPRPPPAEHAEQISGFYERSVDTAQRLAQSHGVETFFFWQPFVTDKSDVGAGEDFAASGKWPRFVELWDALSPLTTDVAVDLRDVYDDTSEPVFTDVVHTNELGARLVAESMYEVLEPSLTRPQGG